MRIISKAVLREFSKKHPDALEPLLHWYAVTKGAAWGNPAEVRASFAHADFVGRYTVFNVGGNKYRLIATVKYRWHIVYVRAILTHAEYDEEVWKA